VIASARLMSRSRIDDRTQDREGLGGRFSQARAIVPSPSPLLPPPLVPTDLCGASIPHCQVKYSDWSSDSVGADEGVTCPARTKHIYHLLPHPPPSRRRFPVRRVSPPRVEDKTSNRGMQTENNEKRWTAKRRREQTEKTDKYNTRCLSSGGRA